MKILNFRLVFFQLNVIRLDKYILVTPPNLLKKYSLYTFLTFFLAGNVSQNIDICVSFFSPE